MATAAQRMLTAVLAGDVDGVAELLDGDPQLADLADPAPGRLSVLHHAARRGDVLLVGLLLAAGASPNKRTHDGSSPLYLAALGGSLEVVRALLAAGADTRTTTNQGYSALAAARVGGNPAVVELLSSLPQPSIHNTFRGKREWS
jgi:ankyrin repeat protein